MEHERFTEITPRRLWGRVIGGVVVTAALAATIGYGLHATRHLPHSAAASKPGKTVAVYKPATASGLATNEYAAYNPDDPAAKKSRDWSMTSGSLFIKNGNFWTGKPDSCDEPDASSANCTNSNVFRLNSVRKFTGNVSMSVAVRQNAEIHDTHCNDGDTCWHGTHLWLDYQSEYNLYYVSVNRADDNVVIKRKVPCGTDNDGTYVELSQYVKHPFATGQWNSYRAALRHNADGSNTINLYGADGKTIVSGTDHGGTNPNWSATCQTPGKYPSAAYPPLPAAGTIGVRGDFADTSFGPITITQ